MGKMGTHKTPGDGRWRYVLAMRPWYMALAAAAGVAAVAGIMATVAADLSPPPAPGNCAVVTCAATHAPAGDAVSPANRHAPATPRAHLSATPSPALAITRAASTPPSPSPTPARGHGHGHGPHPHGQG